MLSNSTSWTFRERIKHRNGALIKCQLILLSEWVNFLYSEERKRVKVQYTKFVPSHLCLYFTSLHLSCCKFDTKMINTNITLNDFFLFSSNHYLLPIFVEMFQFLFSLSTPVFRPLKFCTPIFFLLRSFVLFKKNKILNQVAWTSRAIRFIKKKHKQMHKP